LYFEDENLERHGFSYGIAQPAVSAAHFFGSFLTMPYQMVDQHPHECVYTLGYDRPGTCTPYYHHRLPVNGAAGLAEAGVITGLIFLVP
jgi:hypothetical protein